MKKAKIITLLGLLSPFVGWTQHIEKPTSSGYKTTFAIVVDQETYQHTKKEILDYRAALEGKGMGTYIVSHAWKRPDEIKAVLQKFYEQNPRLEGAVLIGDIPVPMIRDAQHLTSTFKMDQRITWQRSSVPSDRFYDDFDLQFDFLKQDSLKSNLYYYSLSPASPQYIGMDIYTARIKPSVQSGQDRFEPIRKFLIKAVTQSKQNRKLSQALVFSGHGYHSESLNAWGGEHISLKEQFPSLFLPGNSFRFMNFRMAPEMKFPLLSEIRRDDLDIAIFHGHGDEESQIINGYPYASNPSPSIENVKRYLRSKIRTAHEKKQNVAETKRRFVESLGVPMAWMDDALTDSVTLADSVFNANLDINIADIKAAGPNVRFMMMDACDNGSFEEDEYIAAQYAFGNGNNVLTMANSVGVIQDQWAAELLGITGHGVRFGNWLKQIAYLETHFFGDPTFAFDSSEKPDLNDALVNKTKNSLFWEKLLSDKSADVRSLALKQLFKIKGAAVSPLLRQTYFMSEYATTRLEALLLLNKLNNNDYQTVLTAAVSDPYELVRRLAVSMMGDSGADVYVPVMVQTMLREVKSERVSYNLRNALNLMNTETVLSEIDKQMAANTHLTDAKTMKEQLRNTILYTRKKLDKDFGDGFGQKNQKEKLFNLRSLRAYNYHQVVPQVIRVAADATESKDTRIVALEALSWFKHSFQQPLIADMCTKLLTQTSDTELIRQIEKTQSIIGLSEKRVQDNGLGK